MESPFLLSFRPDTTFTQIDVGEWLLLSTWERLSFKQLSSNLIEAIQNMLTVGIYESDAAKEIFKTGGQAEVAKFYYYLQIFSDKRMLCYTIQDKDHLIATIAPISPYFHFEEQKIELEQSYRLSRFASCRMENQTLMLESPLGHCKLILHDSRLAMLFAEFCTPTTIRDLRRHKNILPIATIRHFVMFLLNANLICPINQDGCTDEDNNSALTQWEFHDLLFHTRTRLGRNQNPFGGTYRFVGTISPLPAIKPQRMDSAAIDLYRPDIESLKQNDITFTRVLEERASIRDYGPEHLTARQLGEFLFRTARVKSSFSNQDQELTQRPYPAGGAIYELEFYLAIRDGADLTPGLYHYDPGAHQLEQYSVLTPDVEKLLILAAQAAQAPHIQILIILAARFQRVSWKYQSMAYATILKNVGVVYQTMYLVATAMGLAGCALGGSDSDVFARAANTEYLEETSVGEFILGAK